MEATLSEPIFTLPPVHFERAVLPQAEQRDWWQKFLGIEEIAKVSTGARTRFCVLDTGVDYEHPDLKEGVVDAKDFTRSINGPMDVQNHGTWCAGAAGARLNDRGVAGVIPNCKLYCGKVLGDNGNGSESSIISGIKWAIDIKAHILSMSFGGPRMSPTVKELLQVFVNQGGIPLAAAGNDGTIGRMGLPAAWGDVLISVGASDQTGQRASFSNGDAQLDLIGPGVNALSTITRASGSYGTMSGTSMSTPIVAACVGLAVDICLAAGVVFTMQDAKRLLRATATDTGAPGRDAETGSGIINVRKFLEAVQSTLATPAPVQGKELFVGEWDGGYLDPDTKTMHVNGTYKVTFTPKV